MSTVCVLEDGGWRGSLPFIPLHPCWELVAGSQGIVIRVHTAFSQSEVCALCQPWMEAAVCERPGLLPPGAGGRGVFINGLTVDAPAMARQTRFTDGPFALRSGHAIAASRLDQVPGELPAPDHVPDRVRSLELPEGHEYELRFPLATAGRVMARLAFDGDAGE